jgi:hypothetical protein
MGADALKIGGGAVIVIVFSIIAKLFCIWPFPCTEDGNPVGFHFHGLAKIDRTSSVALSKCSATAQCTLYINIAIGKQGAAAAAPTPTPCPANNNCFNFSNFDGQPMYVSSEDTSTPHPEEPVQATGAVEVAPAGAKHR